MDAFIYVRAGYVRLAFARAFDFFLVQNYVTRLSSTEIIISQRILLVFLDIRI